MDGDKKTEEEARALEQKLETKLIQLSSAVRWLFEQFHNHVKEGESPHRR